MHDTFYYSGTASAAGTTAELTAGVWRLTIPRRTDSRSEIVAVRVLSLHGTNCIGFGAAPPATFPRYLEAALVGNVETLVGPATFAGSAGTPLQSAVAAGSTPIPLASCLYGVNGANESFSSLDTLPETQEVVLRLKGTNVALLLYARTSATSDYTGFDLNGAGGGYAVTHLALSVRYLGHE